MTFASRAKSSPRLAVFAGLAVSLFLALLLTGCADDPASPTPAVTELPAPSTPGLPLITAADAIQQQIDQANQVQPPSGIQPTPTPTRPPGPAPRLVGTFPAINGFPAPVGDPNSVKLLATLTGQNQDSTNKTEPFRALAFSPDYRMMVVADELDSWLIDTSTGKLVQSLKGGANSLAWSPDGSLLAAGGFNGIILLYRWDKPTGQFRNGPLRLATSQAASDFGDSVEVAFGPDGKRLAGFTSDGNITVYNTDTGQPQAAFSSDFAGYLSWSPDGLRLADEYLNLHNLSTGFSTEPNSNLGVSGDSPQGVAWSPDGILIAISGDAFELQLAEVPPKAAAGQPENAVTTVKTRVELRNFAAALNPITVMPHLKEGRQVAWSPNGQWVAASNVPGAGQISIWDTSGNLLQTISTGQAPLRVLTWPKDGLLISAGNEGTARFWQLDHIAN